MIRVEYRRSESFHHLTIKGHAGYSAHGNDIVCAAVSAMTAELAGFLERLRAEDGSGGAYDLKSGDSVIAWSRSAKSDTAFDMALVGYEMASQMYPTHVGLQIEAD